MRGVDQRRDDLSLTPERIRAGKVLGKAVHPDALARLYELWPRAVVKVRRDVNDHGNRRTTVFITPEVGRYTETGIVSCDSGDQFTRAYGIREGFRRALEAARLRWVARESGLEPGSEPQGNLP
jgi:hypothetical protein